MTDKLPIQPAGKFILIRRDKDESKSLIIVQNKKPPQSGVVLAVGGKVKDVKVGDRVQHVSGEFKLYPDQNSDLALVNEDNIIGIFG